MLACLALAGVVLLAGCASGQPARSTSGPGATGSQSSQGALRLPWPRPQDQQARVQAAGLALESHESLQVHYHAHLDVYVDGKPVPVPAGLGINVGPNGEAPDHGQPGIAPLHTHDPSGVVHIEAPESTQFTLGQVFTEWGVALSPQRVGAYDDPKVYVNGKRQGGDPRQIVLAPHQEIAVVAGGGSVQAPSTYDFPAGE